MAISIVIENFLEDSSSGCKKIYTDLESHLLFLQQLQESICRNKSYSAQIFGLLNIKLYILSQIF